MRGLQQSQPIEWNVMEAQRLADSGVKELLVIGQDTTTYGWDLEQKKGIHNLYDQLDKIVKRAVNNNVKCLLTICTTLESYEKIKIIITKYKDIYGTVGIHPHETGKFLNVNSEYILTS